MGTKGITQALAGAGVLATVLSGCGGGDGTAPAATEKAAAVAAAPATQAVTTRVIDGALANALVCLDANDNGACDAGEAQGRSDATGKATLQVPSASVGKAPLLAVVGTDAVDKVFGKVATRFVLQAPADQSGLVTPLTTLVRTYQELAGGTTAAAATAIQNTAGLGVSPLADFSAGTDAASVRAATLARLVVLTQQQAALALQAAVVGKTDLGGATATQADLDKAIRITLLDGLPALGAAAATAADTSLTPAASKEATLLAMAREAVPRDLKLDAAKALAIIGMLKMPLESNAASRQPGVALRGFSFNDANNWFYRANLSTAADNTADASGATRYYSEFVRNAAGTVTRWGFHGNPARANDMHWNGKAWASCPLGFRSSQAPRAAGGWSYSYCAGRETGVSATRAVDLGGQTLLAGVTRLRSFPGVLDGVPYASWGPANLDLLGKTAKFPTGSRLRYQLSLTTGTAPSYDVQDSAIVTAFQASIAAGGDARTSSSPACAAVTPDNVASYRIRPAKLESLVSLNPGKPCIFKASSNSSGTSLANNEWWSNSTASLGSLGGAMTQPPGTGGFYTNNALLRVAFGANNTTTYYKCLERSSDGSVRNCTVIGKGSYAIATLGDARVMSFKNLPLLSQRQGFSRVFVERGGLIHVGYQNHALTVYTQARLNMPAANAVLSQLKVPVITPK
ncbi:hypothetical protein [Azohydromonas aeria]|uniref:hypothetical protein n=1 Tax=Azohydromonas aeria TaxID=2590212 RepID=UPI0012F7F2B7|nr:hypothetical protein [Azohydromonas aeria]